MEVFVSTKRCASSAVSSSSPTTTSVGGGLPASERHEASSTSFPSTQRTRTENLLWSTARQLVSRGCRRAAALVHDRRRLVFVFAAFGLRASASQQQQLRQSAHDHEHERPVERTRKRAGRACRRRIVRGRVGDRGGRRELSLRRGRASAAPRGAAPDITEASRQPAPGGGTHHNTSLTRRCCTHPLNTR